MSIRRARRTIAVVALGAALSMVTVPAGQAQAAACKWTKTTTWEMPAGTNHSWLLSNTGGRYEVGRTGLWQGGLTIKNQRGALWEDGKLVLQGVQRPNLHDVNASGLVVGSDTVNDKFVGVTVARDGSTTVLPSDPAWESFSADLVNNAGDIVGTRSNGLDRRIVVVWPASTPGTYRELSTPDVRSLTLKDVDEQGRIVALSDSSVGGFVWDTDGQWRKLAAPGANGYGWPRAIRNGRVVGVANNDAGGGGAEWNAQGAIVRTWRHPSGSADAIGGKGTIAIDTWVGSNRQAVLWRDGVVVDRLPITFYLTGFSEDERTATGKEGMAPATYTCA